MDYDVIIVGGGPVGSSLAYKLAQKNLKIGIIDKKKQIGLPLQCAGIVSKDLKNYNDIPSEFILNEVKGAVIHSQNEELKVQKDENVALVIDRVKYDQWLFQRVCDNGVDVYSENKVYDINIEEGIVYFKDKQLSSKVIVGADGYNSIVSKIMGNKSDYYKASQYLIKLDDSNLNTDYVDLFTFAEFLPGFLWFIPLGDNIYRVGLFSNCVFKKQCGFLDDFFKSEGVFKGLSFDLNGLEILQKYKGYIPIYDDKKQLVKDRALLIGDAASQIKPTTGGGLVLSFKLLDITSDIILDAVVNDDISLLKNYEISFKDKFSKELSYEMKVHKSLDSLSNNGLDYLFKKLKEYDGENLISTYGDMDNQMVLVKEFFKRGLILKLIPSLFKRKISTIWNIK